MPPLDLPRKISWGNFLESDLLEVAQFSKDSLVALKNANILIVGANGFVGSWLAAALIYAKNEFKLDYEITLNFRDLEKIKKVLKLDLIAGVKTIKGNLYDASEHIIVHKLSYSHVIHAATSTSPNFNRIDTESVLSGTAHLLKAITLKNKPVFMHLSSGAVYGAGARQKLITSESDTDLLGNTNDWEYANCKAGIEKMVVDETVAGKLQGCNPRLFSFFGPLIPLDGTFVIGEFVSKALSKQELVVRGAKNSTRSYMYPTDLVSWLLKILNAPTTETIHVGSERAFDMFHLAKEVDKAFFGVGVTISNAQLPSNHYVPGTSLTREMYGLKENITLQTGLERWQNWLKIS